LMVLMCKAVGKSSITESIFENRFMHVAELQRLGAKINIKNNTATIEGNTKFIGAELMSSDLRASVALVLAAIVSTGKSYINRIYHLDRGYEKIENKLKKIGISSEVDLKNHNLNYKIRDHSLTKVPLLLICGKKEVDTNTVTIRRLDSNKQENMELKEFLKKYSALNKAPSI